MQFSRARFFESASTTHHGESSTSVWANIDVLRLGVVEPAAAGLQVHRRDLPPLGAVAHALLEALLLLLVGHREPVLHQDQAGADQHPLELRRRAEELLVLGFRAEAHHVFDAGAVVPGAVEQDDLPGRRQVRRRSAGSTTGTSPARSACRARRPCTTRGLSGSVIRLIAPPLPAASRPSNRTATRRPSRLDPVLQLHQFEVQSGQLRLVVGLLQLGHHGTVTPGAVAWRGTSKPPRERSSRGEHAVLGPGLRFAGQHGSRDRRRGAR